ncbi:MAG: CBS domain-containing protein, partial [Mariprofundaceae bacterium]|nr:CBS domain-containing protein [Mariprofundaceae bacterium]
MFERLQQIQQRLRQRKLKKMRPGRDEQELLTIIRRAEAISSEEERQSLEDFIHFQELRIREIMTPRLDIVYIDVHCSVHDACKKMINKNMVRMPVVNGSLDHVIGMIHIRALFEALVNKQDVALRSMLHEPIWVSELEKVGSLLSRMRSQSHAAIARDEFGGTAGLVTLSDLLGEIFGPLTAAEEQEQLEEITHTDQGIIVSARVRIEDLEDTITLPETLLDGDFDTLGGLLITYAGKIPKQGEEITLGGIHFIIEEATPRCIEKIRV